MRNVLAIVFIVLALSACGGRKKNSVNQNDNTDARITVLQKDALATNEAGETASKSAETIRPQCGDGVVNGGELCDTAIISGPGKCPSALECKDTDDCTVDQLINGGTCFASCLHTPVTGKQHGDGCCVKPNETPPSEDSDCPPLQAYHECKTSQDCLSKQCILFKALKDIKACTVSCNEKLMDIQGGCPTVSADTLPVCISFPDANQARNASCLLTQMDPYLHNDQDGGFITVGDTALGTIQASDDVDLYFLGGAIYDTQVKIVVKPQLGFDPMIIIYDLDLTPFQWVNQGGKSQAESAYTTIPSIDIRSFIGVTSSSGTGTYTISVE